MPGDFVLLPTGTAHTLSSEPDAAINACDLEAAEKARESGAVLRFGGGTVRTRPQLATAVVLNSLIDILLVHLLRTWLAANSAHEDTSWLGSPSGAWIWPCRLRSTDDPIAAVARSGWRPDERDLPPDRVQGMSHTVVSSRGCSPTWPLCRLNGPKQTGARAFGHPPPSQLRRASWTAITPQVTA
jgi:hypothetical protein